MLHWRSLLLPLSLPLRLRLRLRLLALRGAQLRLAAFHLLHRLRSFRLSHWHQYLSLTLRWCHLALVLPRRLVLFLALLDLLAALRRRLLIGNTPNLIFAPGILHLLSARRVSLLLQLFTR